MDLDLELTANFLVLVDEWDFRQAAHELHVSGPTMTRRMQRLERQLGVQLLERDPTGMTGLTSAGMDFARLARPLLAQARAATRAAQARTAVNVLRLGVPSGATSFVPFMDLDAAQVRTWSEFPALRVILVEVPFPLTTRCLPEKHVDLLLTIAPVRHPDVESVPLPLTAARMGVVSERHPLAGVGSVPAEEFCEHALLHNPAIPEEWMRPFWFGDLRPRQDARLTTTHGSNNHRVMRDVLRGSSAMVTLTPDRGALPRGLEPVTLTQAPPLRFHAALRSRDHRAPVRSYLSFLLAGQPRDIV